MAFPITHFTTIRTPPTKIWRTTVPNFPTDDHHHPTDHPPSVTTDHSSVTTDHPNDNNSFDLNTIYIAVGSVVATLIIVFIFYCICKKCCKKKLSRSGSSRRSSSRKLTLSRQTL